MGQHPIVPRNAITTAMQTNPSRRHHAPPRWTQPVRPLIGLLVVWLTCSQPAQAQPQVDVALAGLAYSGSADTLDKRFPYSRRYEAEQKAAGTSIGQQLLRMLSTNTSVQSPPPPAAHRPATR